jgi:hypothetical protein
MAMALTHRPAWSDTPVLSETVGGTKAADVVARLAPLYSSLHSPWSCWSKSFLNLPSSPEPVLLAFSYTASPE